MTKAAMITGLYCAYGHRFRLLKTRPELSEAGYPLDGFGNYALGDGEDLPPLEVGEYVEEGRRYYYYAWADSEEEGENALLAYVNDMSGRLITIQRNRKG